MKEVVAKIEKLREKPLVEKPQFYLSEFNEILRRYAPCYPRSINGNELFELCNAMFTFGYIKGAAHQARKSRQKPHRRPYKAQKRISNEISDKHIITQYRVK